MYKIYINDTPLLLIRQPDEGLPPAGNHELIARYPGKSKFLLHYVNMLENTRRLDRICLYSPDPERMWQDFHKHFAVQENAGAAIMDKGQGLLFRVEDHPYQLLEGPIRTEMPPAAAALEICKAQTGWEPLSISHELPPTYHTRRESKHRLLIKTHWFVLPLPEGIEKKDRSSFRWIEMGVVRSNPDFIPTYISALFEADTVFD